MLNTSHGWGICVRAHVQTALLYLRNGFADWVLFWCVSWESWTRCLTQVMGGVSLHVRSAHVQTALLYLRIGLVDCVQIWYVGWGSLSTCFPEVMGGVEHLCTCALATPPPPHYHLRISGSDWPILLKFDAWLETQLLRDLQKSEVGWLHIRTCVSSFVISETAQPWHWSHTKNRLISFGLARSSPNMAFYWSYLSQFGRYRLSILYIHLLATAIRHSIRK